MRKEIIYGTEQIICEFICNTVQIESFLCYTKYITTCDYMCSRHLNNE